MANRFQRNPEWNQSVFMYNHTLTELFDKLMAEAGRIRLSIEQMEDNADLNEYKQYRLLEKLDGLYDEFTSTSMSDI